jgi:hypothetical protein
VRNTASIERARLSAEIHKEESTMSVRLYLAVMFLGFHMNSAFVSGIFRLIKEVGNATSASFSRLPVVEYLATVLLPKLGEFHLTVRDIPTPSQ